MSNTLDDSADTAKALSKGLENVNINDAGTAIKNHPVPHEVGSALAKLSEAVKGWDGDRNSQKSTRDIVLQARRLVDLVENPSDAALYRMMEVNIIR